MECPDQVLAGVGVDAGLASDGGVDHGQQGGRNVHDVDAAQPGRRHEARDVGGRPAAEADDGVLAADADAAQDLPYEPDDLQVFSCFGVGQFDTVCIDTFVQQRLSDLFGGLGQRRLIQHGHLVPAAEKVAEPVEQAGADDHRVRRVDGHVDGHRAHLRTPARRARVAGVTGPDSAATSGDGGVGAACEGADAEAAGRRQGGRRRRGGCGSSRRPTI